MDNKLSHLLEDLLSNIDVLNAEIERFNRSDMFSSSTNSIFLIEKIKDSCASSMQNINTVERKIVMPSKDYK